MTELGPIDKARAAVIAAAAEAIGGDNGHLFWRVCGGAPYDPKKSWCGIFALWCLRCAGACPESIVWDLSGDGFLFRLPRTTDPKPGDIGYIAAPFQHHFVVERIDEQGVHSIDGNTPIVARKVRPREHITAFYSIEPFILAAHALEAYPEPESVA
jgi:hypothetical protein